MKTKLTLLLLLFLVGKVIPQSTTVKKTIHVESIARNYLIHLPKSYVSGNKTPLIIAFHGMSQDAATMEYHSALTVKSDTSGFIIAYPNGLGNPVEWNENDKSTTKANDVEFTRTLIDTLIANYSIDTTKIFAAGFSDGAGMAMRAACEINRIAAVASIAGAVNPTDYKAKRPVPSICFYSKNDKASLISTMNNALASWSTLNKSVTARDTFFTVAGAVGFKVKGDNNSEFQMYVTDIGGHSWPGGLVSWAVPSKAISANNLLWEFFQKHTNSSITGIKEKSEKEILPAEYILSQNYPNPFNPETTISYKLSVASHVTLKVYDMLGREVALLVDGYKNPGTYNAKFNTHNYGLTSGIYFYQLRSGSFVETKKLVLMK
jgi:polyhydroxybutyrate depolymerase